MDIKKIIKVILKEKGKGNADAARAFGITPQSMISRMRGKSIRVDTVQEMLDELGYSLMVVPKGTRARAGWFSVSGNADAHAPADPPKKPMKPTNWVDDWEETEEKDGRRRDWTDKYYGGGE